MSGRFVDRVPRRATTGSHRRRAFNVWACVPVVRLRADIVVGVTNLGCVLGLIVNDFEGSQAFRRGGV